MHDEVNSDALCPLSWQSECEAAAERVRGIAPAAQGCSSGVRFRAAVLQWEDIAPELARCWSRMELMLHQYMFPSAYMDVEIFLGCYNAGTELYRERFVRALANELCAPLLVLDSSVLAPYVI